jgi:predicted RNA polymerase sigma factor
LAERDVGLGNGSKTGIVLPFSTRGGWTDGEHDAIPERELLAHYPYALATYAELYASLGQVEEARVFLDRALELHVPPAERALLRRKRDALGNSE